jgi:hypothetical protein
VLAATLRLVGSLVLGDLQPEQDLVAVGISGPFEAVSLVEGDRTALALSDVRRLCLVRPRGRICARIGAAPPAGYCRV